MSPSGSSLRLWLAYLVAFGISHEIAGIWDGAYLFSLWYPAAGIRFALLWRHGARWTLPVAAADLIVQSLLSTVVAHEPLSLEMVVNVTLPSLTTGLVIAIIRHEGRRNASEQAAAPLSLGLAAMLAPTVSALVRGGWGWVSSHSDSATTLLPTSVFLLGDMLGVLIVAPFLLWLCEGKERLRELRLSWPDLRQAGIVFAMGWSLALLMPDLRLMPIMLSMTWLGLRYGSKVAWIAIILSSGVTLFWSATVPDIPRQIGLHIGLAVAAVSAYLAGSYTDAQRAAQAVIARRDRLLFQAERLKTLRAMSVAVIHEISQPLSTLAIESRHLAAISQGDTEYARSAALIARKVEILSTMIRRLRRFGGRAVDEPSPLALGLLLGEAMRLALGETGGKPGRVQLAVPEAAIFVMGQEIELTQAFLNLVRNAISASPAGPITIRLTTDAQGASILIANPHAHGVADSGGFGVGSLIARAIIMAHGGTVIREDGRDDLIRHTVRLPTIEAHHA
ncbi:sensor histidine kinase [Sphingomonadaceae bacterium jetA1]|uniref:ATP-binding protein n=1 Tax=Facivitalis istanbulensis TaxID=3075838 RepID=UPI003494D1CF